MEILKTAYGTRNEKRVVTWERATEALIAHYMAQDKTKEEADAIIKPIANELFDNHLPALLKYWTGVGKQDYIDAVNGIDSAVYPAFDDDEKTIVSDILNQTT